MLVQSKKSVQAVFLATRAAVFPNWKFAIGETIVLMVWMKNSAPQGTARGKYFYDSGSQKYSHLVFW